MTGSVYPTSVTLCLMKFTRHSGTYHRETCICLWLLPEMGSGDMSSHEGAVIAKGEVGLSGEICRGQERGAVNDQGGVPALKPSDRDDLE